MASLMHRIVPESLRPSPGKRNRLSSMMRPSLPFLVAAFSCLLSSIDPVNSLSIDPSRIQTAGGPAARSSRSASSSRRKYFGDVLTGGALIAATTTVAPEIAKADTAKVRSACFRNKPFYAHPCRNDLRLGLTHLSCPFPICLVPFPYPPALRYVGRTITTTGTHEDWTSLSRRLVQWRFVVARFVPVEQTWF
jgi:hypothetical protein